MNDGIVRRGIKYVALMRYNFDLGITRFIQRRRGEPGYELRGECTGCGACCETPMIYTIAPFFYLKSLRWLFLTWHRVVNGFEFLEEDRIGRTFVFRCTHLDPETKACDSYSSRPGMCRDYPVNLLYLPRPEFLEGCTFSAVAENADLINETLEELDLTPEQLEKVKREFYSRDNG